MSRLAPLRTQLKSLQRRRAAVRRGCAWSAVAVAVLWALAAGFVIDWTLQLNRTQRAVALLGYLVVTGLAFRRFAAPFLRVRETEIDLALLIERQQGIDSDLVAALQFESQEAPRWGSRQLELAVIEYVADFSSSLNVFEGLSRRQLVQSCGILGATLLALGVVALLFPRHAGVFFNRLLLGAEHYPSRTIIDRIAVNGRTVFPIAADEPFRSPFGRPLQFEVVCSGEAPAAGRIDFRSTTGATRTTLALTPQTHGKAASAVPKHVFAAELPRLVDSVSYQIFVGDAWTDPSHITNISLPIVTLEVDVIPPDYASASERPAEDGNGSRQISVLEGSRIGLRVVCENKRLVQATLNVGETEYALDSEDGTGRRWRLPREKTPFDRITEPLRYVIRVRDSDGLELDQPLQGFIRLKADQGPRIVAAMISRKVLPGAKPKISYGAHDDYGVAAIRLIRQVLRDGGNPDEATDEIETIDPARQPLTNVRGQHTLDLETLKLSKGDQLKITLEVLDYRGQTAGKSALSEPLVLQVTDVQGFLAAMVESDEQSARRLDSIIQRELGIGDSK